MVIKGVPGMSRDLGRIAERIVMGMSQNEQKVFAVVKTARDARQTIDRTRKDLLAVGRKVKYLGDVGTAVSEALMTLEEADLKVKTVVDRGNRFLGD
jgi:hypothetical protein